MRLHCSWLLQTITFIGLAVGFDLTKAELIQRQVVETRERQYSDDVDAIIGSKGELADILVSSKKLEEAEAISEEVLAYTRAQEKKSEELYNFIAPRLKLGLSGRFRQVRLVNGSEL